MDFRPHYQALADRLEADLSDVVAQVSRENLPARAFASQPALVVVEGGWRVIRADGAPPAYELAATLVLHSQVSGDDPRPGDSVLALVDRIDRALLWRAGEPRSDDGESSTLGGLAAYVRLGDVTIQDDPVDAKQVSTQLEVSVLVFPQG